MMNLRKTVRRENSLRIDTLKNSPRMERSSSEPAHLRLTQVQSRPSGNFSLRPGSPSARKYFTKQLNKFREVSERLRSHQDQPVETLSQQSRQPSQHSLNETVRSIPLTPSDSGDEFDRGINDPQGERTRVRELEDLANWAPAEPVQVIGRAPSQNFSHLPDWSTLELPFRPIEREAVTLSSLADDQTSSSLCEGSDHMTFSNTEESATESRDIHVIPPLTPDHESRVKYSASERLTAYPQETVLRQDIEQRLLSQLDFKHFEQFLLNPEAREVFRSWLIHSSATYGFGAFESGTDLRILPRNVIKLDQWTDESLASDLSDRLRVHSEALLDIYYGQSAPPLSPSRPKAVTRSSFIDALQLASSKQIFETSRNWLLQSLYEQDFKHFITGRLIDMCKMKLGTGIADKDYSGLGDSFVLTNPRFQDNPIVIVSPGFAAVTGYDPGTIIGRNCRFLQGPQTCPKSIERLRYALRAGEPCVELLLNYRSDGTPFQCLLSILPLFDQAGALTYFVGGQVNITGEIEACGDLAAFACSSTEASSRATELSNDFSPSPTMKRHLERQSINGGARGGIAAPNHKIDAHRPQILMSDAGRKPLQAKRATFEWLMPRVKREKEVLNSDFNGSAARFVSPKDTFESNIRTFQTSYSRLFIFKKLSRAIVFVTPETLRFLGLPTETHSDTYSSALIHTDFLDLIEASKVNRRGRNLRAALKKVIQSNTAGSFQCNLVWKYIPYMDESGTLNKSKKVTVTRNCFIHLSPLIDCSSKCTSYLAVLG